MADMDKLAENLGVDPMDIPEQEHEHPENVADVEEVTYED